MKKNLDQKVAIVTGGARGLGKGIANSLLLNGAKVVIFDSNKENGIQTESELNKKYKDCVFFFEGDVSLKKDNEKAVELAVNTYGKLDIVCANAGIFPLTWIKDISEKDVKATVKKITELRKKHVDLEAKFLLGMDDILSPRQLANLGMFKQKMMRNIGVELRENRGKKAKRGKMKGRRGGKKRRGF